MAPRRPDPGPRPNRPYFPALAAVPRNPRGGGLTGRGAPQPTHTLPTVTVEQFGLMELERMEAAAAAKEAAEAEAAAAAAADPHGPGHECDECDDAETMKQRRWDDFKDANPRGWGNSKTTPCG